MSITTYDPNSAATVNALTQTQLLDSQIEVLIEKLRNAQHELKSYVHLASTGAVISTLSAPDTKVIEECAYALRGAQSLGNQAYLASTAIKTASTLHPNICRLDIQ